MRFVKIPIVVEAIKIEKDMYEGNLAIDPELRDMMIRYPRAFENALKLDYAGLRITRSNGDRVTCGWGEYLVMDNMGYGYPVEADIFEKTHRKAVNGDA